MPSTLERIAQLSDKRRDLLNVLRQKQLSENGQSTEDSEPTPELELVPGSSPEEVKSNARKFYNTISRQLNSSELRKLSYFLNFGFKPDGSDTYSVIDLPAYVLNKNSVRMALELIGNCDLAGRSVLDVGCGRGGVISVIKQYFNPKCVVGLDFSSEAIRFCQQVHGPSGALFLESDAECFPFEDDSFDVISNLESSHSYPSIDAFYAEVRRVLKNSGHFLYSDLFPHAEMQRHINHLRRLGFSVVKDHDITTNVLLSCDEISEMRTQTFNQSNDKALMGEFLATPGSAVYQDMASGVTTYRMFDLMLTKSPG